MRPRSIQISKETLEMMYVTERRELKEIGQALGACEATICARLREFGITRTATSIDMDIVKIMYLDDGKTITEIADYIGYSRGGIRKMIVKEGWLRPRVKVAEIGKAIAKWVPSEDELRQMYLVDGMSDAAIGRKCGVHNITVAAWRAKAGIKREYLYNALEIPADELKTMYLDQKMNMESIAKRFGCGESTVRIHIIKNGFGLDSKEVADRRMAANRERCAYTHKVDGYQMIRVEGHPFANRDGYVSEHRYIVEQSIGRHLETHEQVHHINVDKSDNRVENLAVLLKDEHATVHKYMERVAAYMCRLTDKKPAPVVFDREVFWGGKYVRTIDLAVNRDYKFLDTRPAVGHMAFVN